MTRLTRLILAVSVGSLLGAFPTSGTMGVVGPATARAQTKPTKPSDNKSTREATRAIGLAMLREGSEMRALYEQALQHALASIESQPGNPKGWFLAGQAYANLGDLAGADSAFKRAQEIYPEYEPEIDPERENAWVAAYNEAITAYQQNDLAAAIAQLELADRIYQKRPEARLNLGAFYAQQDQTDQAIEAYRGALEILSQPVPEALDSAGRQDWAENEEIAAFNLADLLMAAGRHDEVEQVYREFMERRPDDLSIQVRLAEALAQQGKSAEAGEAYGKLLSRTDLTDGNYLMIGVGLFRAEDHAGAANAFRGAIEKNPYSRDAYYNLAQSLYVRAGQLDEAHKQATGEAAKAIATDLLALHRDLAQAAEKVLEFDPYNRNILAYMARAYQALSQVSSEAEEKQRFQARVHEVVEQHDSFAFEVNDISIRTSEGEVRFSGTVKNLKVTAGQPILLRVTLLSSMGSSIGESEVTITTPAVESSAAFEVAIPVTGPLAGWKYERTQ